MKKRLAVVLMVLLVFMLPLIALASQYVGNSNSGKFHYSSCRWAQKIASYNRVDYDSREDAVNDGYVPCKVCRP